MQIITVTEVADSLQLKTATVCRLANVYVTATIEGDQLPLERR